MSDDRSCDVSPTERTSLLELIVTNGPIGILALARETDRSPDRVRTIIEALESDTLIEPSSDGLVPTDRAKAFAAGLDTFELSIAEFGTVLRDRDDSSSERIEIVAERRGDAWTARTVDDSTGSR